MNIVEKKIVVQILDTWMGELQLLKTVVEYSMSLIEETEKAVEQAFPDSELDGVEDYALDSAAVLYNGEEIPTYPEPESGSGSASMVTYIPTKDGGFHNFYCNGCGHRELHIPRKTCPHCGKQIINAIDLAPGPERDAREEEEQC